MTKESIKAFCLGRLAAKVTTMENAKTPELRTYYATQLEGFLDGLFFAEVIDEDEYSALGEKITSVYLKGGEF